MLSAKTRIGILFKMAHLHALKNGTPCQCPKCKVTESVFIKNGKVGGKQRFRCTSCGYQFTTIKVQEKPSTVKEQAITRFMDGASLRTIGKELNISHQTVANWVNEYAASSRENQMQVDDVKLYKQFPHLKYSHLMWPMMSRAIQSLPFDS